MRVDSSPESTEQVGEVPRTTLIMHAAALVTLTGVIQKVRVGEASFVMYAKLQLNVHNCSKGGGGWSRYS